MMQKNSKKEIDFSVKLDNGKYEYIFYKDGTACSLRYGEYWQDLTGNNLVFNLAYELNCLKKIKNKN